MDLLFFYAAKMRYMGKTTWKITCAYRIPVPVRFGALHMQVGTRAQSGEQLPLTRYIAKLPNFI